MTINERVKYFRKEILHISQTEFASSLGMKQTGVSYMERNGSTVTDQTIKAICLLYNVNEEWLRTGSGDMFQPQNRNTDIARLTKQLLNEESDSFKNRFISMLSKLSVEEWEFLERAAEKLCGTQHEAPPQDKPNQK